jgi:hypothetical protein
MQKIEFAMLERLAQASAAVTTPCSCTEAPLNAWTAQPLTLELDRLEDIGTLLDDPYDEPTFTEYHPAGTRYESVDAPIAPRFYPYNRCTVTRCMTTRPGATLPSGAFARCSLACWWTRRRRTVRDRRPGARRLGRAFAPLHPHQHELCGA